MIIDKLEYASRYYGLNYNLDYVLKYLVEHEKELKESPIGITRFTENIQGKCIAYNTVVGSRKWESHEEFTDLQYMLKGTERIGFNHEENMVNSKKQEGKDQILHEGDGDKILLPEGYFIILFPGEVHMSKLADGPSTCVEKAAFKIRL